MSGASERSSEKRQRREKERERERERNGPPRLVASISRHSHHRYSSIPNSIDDFPRSYFLIESLSPTLPWYFHFMSPGIYILRLFQTYISSRLSGTKRAIHICYSRPLVSPRVPILFSTSNATRLSPPLPSPID